MANSESDRVQYLMSKLAENVAAETKADMEAEIAAKQEQVRTEVMADYANRYGQTEENDERVTPLRKMLSSLVGKGGQTQ